MCDHARHRLIEVAQRLNDVQSGDTALPTASQQVQNMLADADYERQKLCDHATRQAEKIRSTAQAQARRLVEEARHDLAAVRRHCAGRIAELDIRRQQLQREHADDLHTLKERQERMHQGIHGAYQRALANAEQQAIALLERTRQRDEQARADTQRLCVDAQDELDAEHTRLETLWQAALSNVDNRTTGNDKDSAW
jgi:cell division septum initiation protein DivIVA